MRKLATAAAVSLALASGGAFGLGLGEIEMQSALNQPMSAEIRLTSVKPGELDGMIVQLASSEAFARAGIERSSALTGLSFRVDQSSGTPVIKIESTRPVVEPFLNFLLEVDWPQGRMVREYTVLLDPPVFMSPSASERNAAADQPTIVQSGETALVVPTPIERQGASANAGLESGLSTLGNANTQDILSLDEATASSDLLTDGALLSGGTGVADALGNPIGLTDQGVPNTTADAQRRADAAFALGLGDIQVQTPDSTEEISDDVVVGDDGQLRLESIGSIERLGDDQGSIVSLDEIEEPVRPAISTGGAAGSVTVGSGDTLFEIATETAPSGVSVQQMMLAILAANESSFIDNNINLVKAGAILRIPDTGEATSLSQSQAVAAISDQNQLWQEYRDSLRSTASTSVARNTAPEAQNTDAIDTAAVDTESVGDGLSDEARAILENARQEILDGEELRIVADNATADTAASATADETSDSGEDARVGEVNRRLQLAREELSASRLRTTDLSEQAVQLEETTSNLEAMVSLRQDEVARLESQLAEARQAEEGGAQAAADSMTDAATDVVTDATGAVTDATGAVTDAASNATDAAGNLVTDATNAAGDAADNALNAAGDAVDGVDVALPDVPTSVTDMAPVEGAQGWFQQFLDDPKRMAIAGVGGLGLLGVLGTLLYRRKRKDPATMTGAAADLDTSDAQTIRVNEEAHPLADTVAPASPDIGSAQGAAAEAEKANLFDGTGAFDKAGAAGVAGVAAATGFVGTTTGPEHGDSIDYLDRTFAGDDQGDSTLSFESTDASGMAMFGNEDNDADAMDTDDTISEVDVYLNYGLHGQAEELLTKAVARSPDNPEYVSKLLSTYHAQGNSEAFRTTAADYHVRFGGDSNPEWAALAAMGAELDPGEALYMSSKDVSIGSGHTDRAALSEEDFTTDADGADVGSVSRDFTTNSATNDFTESETALMDASLDPAFAFDEGDLEATGDFSAIASEVAGEDATPSSDDGNVKFSGSAANESLKGAGLAAAAGVGAAAGLGASSLDDAMSAVPRLDTTSHSSDDLTLDLDQLSGDLELESAELLNTDLADLDLPDLTADNELLLDSTGQFGTGADEMDTMMDLAKAYIDMGDKDSASSALGEIVKSGSPEQVNEAETLLRKIS